MNIASFHFSLPTTPRVVSFLPPLPLGATPAFQMGTRVVQKSQVQRLRLRNADLCCCWNRRWTEYHEWILVTQVSGMKWDTFSHWDYPKTSFVKDQNILMPCESLVNPVTVTRKVHHSIGVSATAVHQYPTWNNQRWFFDVLLCHGKSRSHCFWASQLVCLKQQVKSEGPQFCRFQLLSPR